MNMALTPLVPTMETLIYSSRGSMSTTMKQLVSITIRTVIDMTSNDRSK